MTKEVAQAFGHMSEKINEMGRRIDNLYAQLHSENAENIETNTEGINELAGTIDAQNMALNDLATAVAELEE